MSRAFVLTSVGPEDLLVPEGEPGALGGAGGLDALQLEAGQGALRDGRGLLDVLEHQPGNEEAKWVEMSAWFELILHRT